MTCQKAFFRRQVLSELNFNVFKVLFHAIKLLIRFDRNSIEPFHVFSKHFIMFSCYDAQNGGQTKRMSINVCTLADLAIISFQLAALRA